MSDNKIVMRSKAVLSIIAFLAAFGISVAVTPRQSKPSIAPYVSRGCAKTETARRITNLLSQDIENGRRRDRRIDSLSEVRGDELPYGPTNSFADFATAINQYVDASASIDDSDLPRDFKAAWRRHLKAWENHSDFLNEVKGAAQKRNDSNYGFSRKEYREQIREISETWSEVLRVARTYDTYVPVGAY